MIDDLNRNIRELVRTVMAMEPNSVRPADQIMPAGTQSQRRATVKIIEVKQVGITRREFPAADPNLTESIESVQVVTASINFFGGTKQDPAGLARSQNWGLEMATRLGPRLRLAASIELQLKLGVLLLSEGTPRNLSGVVDATYESRGQVDMTFTAANREQAAVPTLVSAEVELQIQESAGIETRTFEVP